MCPHPLVHRCFVVFQAAAIYALVDVYEYSNDSDADADEQQDAIRRRYFCIYKDIVSSALATCYGVKATACITLFVDTIFFLLDCGSVIICSDDTYKDLYKGCFSPIDSVFSFVFAIVWLAFSGLVVSGQPPDNGQLEARAKAALATCFLMSIFHVSKSGARGISA